MTRKLEMGPGNMHSPIAVNTRRLGIHGFHTPEELAEMLHTKLYKAYRSRTGQGESDKISSVLVASVTGVMTM